MVAPPDKLTLFHALHGSDSGGPLVLPNAWDALSARAMQESGADAIGTTSGGVSWSLGFQDGQGVSRDMMVDAVSRIVAAVRVPVTADIESGYGSGSPAEVAETVRMVISTGAVGINLEDSPGPGSEPLLDTAAQCRRLEAARAAAEDEGVRLFINARLDTYLFEVGDPASRTHNAIVRARAYVESGADGFFVPGVTTADLVAELAHAVDAPLNIMATPDAPNVLELARLGVRRVSVGSGMAQRVIAFVKHTTGGILDSGEFGSLGEAPSFSEANALFEGAEVAGQRPL